MVIEVIVEVSPNKASYAVPLQKHSLLRIETTQKGMDNSTVFDLLLILGVVATTNIQILASYLHDVGQLS